MMKFLFWYF